MRVHSTNFIGLLLIFAVAALVPLLLIVRIVETSAATPESNLVADSGFEGSVVGDTITNPNWPSTSTNFGTPLCSISFCGGSGGSAPRNGIYYLWFGGTVEAETATASQTLVVPTGSNPVLKYWLRISAVSSPFNSIMNVKVDGTVIQTITEPQASESAYTMRSISIPQSFADGVQHTITFEYKNPSASGTSNFNVDDVTLETAGGSPTPSPTPTPASTNIIVDGGLETSVTAAAITNQNWPSTSTNFETAICSPAFCGSTGSSAPRGGSYYLWFGGTTQPETGTASQSLIIPAGSNPILRYWLRINTVSSPFNSKLDIKIDGTVIQTIGEPTTPELDYLQRSIAIPASFANGSAHSITFEYTNPVASGTSNFTVDDITLETSSVSPTPTPTGAGAISGRVFTASGQAIRNASVLLTDSQGFTRTATTSSFGIYSFGGLTTGHTYIIGVSSKRYRFTPRDLLANGNLADVDFTGLE